MSPLILSRVVSGKQSYKDLASSCWQNWFWHEDWTACDNISWQNVCQG